MKIPRFLIRAKRKPIRAFIGILLICLMLHQIILLQIYSISFPSWINVEDYPPFEPEITDDFPTVYVEKPRIPHIIHQTYKSELIPWYYLQYIKSFVTFNPGWQYILWTDSSSRKLVAERHPYLLHLWDSYPKDIYRADVIRYIALYEFGGVYADMDFECLRPLKALTYKYACILPTEPFEMAAIERDSAYLISNAIMLCRPKHPFLKQLIKSLSAYQVMKGVIETTGPYFVTSQFIFYNNILTYYGPSHKSNNTESNSPYFYKGELPETHDNAIYVPNSKYFFNSLDNHSNRILRLHYRCKSFSSMRYNQQRGCLELIKRYKQAKTKYAYTEHHWFQMYNSKFNILFKSFYKQYNISNIVNDVRIYQ